MTKIRQKLIRMLGGVPKEELENLNFKYEVLEVAYNEMFRTVNRLMRWNDDRKGIH